MKSTILLLLLVLAILHPTKCHNILRRSRELLLLEQEQDPHTATRPHYQSTTSFLNRKYDTRPEAQQHQVERATAKKRTTGVGVDGGVFPNRPPVMSSSDSGAMMIDIECEADGIVQECGLHGTTDVGIFVCRRYNGEHYYTGCVLPDAGQEGDKCGCCSGYCPMQCKCPCEMMTSGGGKDDAPQQGVWIQQVGNSTRKLCVEPLDSMTRQLGDRFECGTC